MLLEMNKECCLIAACDMRWVKNKEGVCPELIVKKALWPVFHYG
jgi:hypothetical protein